jgi:hypothetical protein
MLVPPQESNIRSGLFCPEGEQPIAPIGPRFNSLVTASYRREGTPVDLDELVRIAGLAIEKNINPP